MGDTCSVGVSREEEPGCDPISLDDLVAKAIIESVRLQSEGYEQRYKCRMKVSKFWRVRECAHLREYRREADKFGAPTQLFHGSTPQKVSRIARSGFELPTHAGMFGKGVYFAR